MAETEAQSLKMCVLQLRSTSSRPLMKSLIAIRMKYIKEPGGIQKFCAYGGLKNLIELIQKTNQKIVDISLSILGNCCTEEGARDEVRALGGIAAVEWIVQIISPTLRINRFHKMTVMVLKCIGMENIRNRAARVVGNLALNKECAKLLHGTGVCLDLAAVLESCQSWECLQSAVRALRNLGDTPAHRRAMATQGVLQPLVRLLSCKEDVLVASSTQTLAELSCHCSAEFAETLARENAFSALVAITGGEKEGPRRDALRTLSRLCRHGAVRPGLGSAGIVTCLVNEILSAVSCGRPQKEPRSRDVTALCVHALCLCCREAVNRVRVIENNGLEVLLELLRDEHHRASHGKILEAFLHFFYEDTALEQLQAAGLITVLAERLLEWTHGKPGRVPDHNGDQDQYEMEDERFSASFDFPSEHTQRGEMEPSAESSSFLSMRSWLLNEGVIMSPGDVSPQWSLEMSGADVDFGEVQNRPDQQTVMVLPPSSELNSPSDCGNFGIRYPKSSRNTSCANHCKLVHIDATASPALRRKRTLADQTSSIGTPKIDPGGRHEELIEVVHTTQSKVGLAHCKDVLHSPPGGSPVAPPEPRGFISQGTSEQIGAQSLSAPDKGPLRFDSAILWLLSRFSYALQPTGLVSELVIRTLLDYITVAQQPSARAGRILHRLTCNPNCLEVFVRSRGPALLHMRLIHGVFPEALLRGTFESHSPECCQQNVARHRQDSHRSNGDEQPKVECDLDENSTLSTSSHQKLGSQLLRNLRVQAVSDFGVGTLAHMLLAARSDDRVACALALPYMYRNEPLRRKMLVEYSGLRFLLHTMLQCTDASYMPMAVDALSCLSDVQTRNLTADSPGRKYFMEEATTVPEHAAVFGGDTLQEPHCAYRSIQQHLNCLQCGSNIFTDCQCVLSSAEGSDVVYFRLDSGKLVRAHRSTVAGSSEVFAAMLQGHFAEACLDEIPVCDVTDSAFLLLMHHLHGCNLCTCPILCANCTIHTSGPFDDELKDEVETMETTLNNPTQHFAIGKPFPNELSQLMALANRFLLSSLKTELTSLMQSQLSWHYLSQVFAFAHLHGFEDLCLSCLRYLCTAPLSLFQRTLCLQHIMQSGVDVEKMEDILHSVLLLYT